ncbi:D-aminoacyl-tRNA deacylase [soil metagenome]
MKAVIQRVNSASVTIDGDVYSKIGQGLLVLLGICIDDADDSSAFLSKKITDLRIFNDDAGKMNLSVKDIKGEILLISQFTLCADNGKSGNRPSFINAAKPEISKPLYEKFILRLKESYSAEKIKTGVFGADMKVDLLNDGPVTIILER